MIEYCDLNAVNGCPKQKREDLRKIQRAQTEKVRKGIWNPFEKIFA